MCDVRPSFAVMAKSVVIASIQRQKSQVDAINSNLRNSRSQIDTKISIANISFLFFWPIYAYFYNKWLAEGLGLDIPRQICSVFLEQFLQLY